MLKFTDRFMNKSRNELTAYDASEGALYVIFCAVLCLLPQSPKLLAIDNLDQALNPRAGGAPDGQSAGLAAPRRARPPAAVHRAQPGGARRARFPSDPEVRLFAVERNSNGLTRVRRLELTPELAALNQQYPLSRLWLMGHLGAVPNV